MQLFDTHFHFYGEVTPLQYAENISLALQDPKQSEKGSVEKLFLNANKATLYNFIVLCLGFIAEALNDVRMRQYARCINVVE